MLTKGGNLPTVISDKKYVPRKLHPARDAINTALDAGKAAEKAIEREEGEA